MRRNSSQTADLESDILKRIRVSEGISRASLARELGLSGSTSGVYVGRLMEEGFLTEAIGKAARDGGRPAKLLHLNPNGGEFIGVDFEARNIMAVAVDFAERPVRRFHDTIAENDSVERIVAKIEQAILAVCPEDPRKLLSIGLGVPGVVDPAKGISVRYEYLPHWKDVPLSRMIGDRFRVPVFLENTMRAMALAELWFGHGRGCDNFVCVCIRSGMGAGIVSNGRLHRGQRNLAGELGHCRVAAGAPAGQLGLGLQDVVSARSIQLALQRAIASGKATRLSGTGLPSLDEIVAASRAKDPLTLQVIEQAAAALGAGLAPAVLMLDPQKVVLAGQLTPLGDTFLDPVRQAVAAEMAPSGLEPPPIMNSTIGEFLGAVGAAALALHEWKPARG